MGKRPRIIRTALCWSEIPPHSDALRLGPSTPHSRGPSQRGPRRGSAALAPFGGSVQMRSVGRSLQLSTFNFQPSTASCAAMHLTVWQWVLLGLGAFIIGL